MPALPRPPLAMIRRSALALGLGLGAALGPAGQVLAHPHIFVETRLTLLMNGAGQVEGLRINWLYDDFTTLTILAEKGVDLDLDGHLTPSELASLQGFDMEWEPGFAGDTYALLDASPLALGPPTAASASYDGTRLASSHERRFGAPIALSPGQTLIVQSYDPGYYTNYTVEEAQTEPPLRPTCKLQIFAPDLDQADAQLKEALAELTPDQDAETFFPAIGAAFAEEARLTCGP